VIRKKSVLFASAHFGVWSIVLAVRPALAIVAVMQPGRALK
jgi:hypothetical protein